MELRTAKSRALPKVQANVQSARLGKLFCPCLQAKRSLNSRKGLEPGRSFNMDRAGNSETVGEYHRNL